MKKCIASQSMAIQISHGCPPELHTSSIIEYKLKEEIIKGTSGRTHLQENLAKQQNKKKNRTNIALPLLNG